MTSTQTFNTNYQTAMYENNNCSTGIVHWLWLIIFINEIMIVAVFCNLQFSFYYFALLFLEFLVFLNFLLVSVFFFFFTAYLHLNQVCFYRFLLEIVFHLAYILFIFYPSLCLSVSSMRSGLASAVYFFTEIKMRIHFAFSIPNLVLS